MNNFNYPIHNWKLMLDKIIQMRAKKKSVVDEKGCHMCADPLACEKTQRFQILVSLLLSSQTKDEITFLAMQKLKETGLNIQSMLEIEAHELEKIIYPVGFYKKKANFIKSVASILRQHYNDDIPHSVEDIKKLPGIGPKMAYIAMNVAWNKTVGIGVDTHVHRIAKRLHWVSPASSNPEQTRKQLESWLPLDLWGNINQLLVGFGQEICKPINPKCKECLINDICPSSQIKNKF